MATSNTTTFPFPTPKSITGGCNCKALRYRVDFPPDHDFNTKSGTCQCTQCRKQTGSLFFIYHNIRPASTSFRFTSPSTASLKVYRASADGERGFCSECGSFLYWRRREHEGEGDYLCLAIGSVDALYLFGEGADGVEVPEGGFGMALANVRGGHTWCANEIKGVTDGESMELLTRGEREMEG